MSGYIVNGLDSEISIYTVICHFHAFEIVAHGAVSIVQTHTAVGSMQIAVKTNIIALITDDISASDY